MIALRFGTPSSFRISLIFDHCGVCGPSSRRCASALGGQSSAVRLTKAIGCVTFHHPRNYFDWLRHGVRNFHDFKQLHAFMMAHSEFDHGMNPSELPPEPPRADRSLAQSNPRSGCAVVAAAAEGCRKCGQC